jgi:uncharacterized protein DUF4031
MAVYVDQAIWRWQGLAWCHLLADDADELHRFAALLGIKRTSFQSPPKSSAAHYDLTAFERRQAIARGAVSCSRDEMVAVLRRLRASVPEGNQPRSTAPGSGSRPGAAVLP